MYFPLKSKSKDYMKVERKLLSDKRKGVRVDRG